MTKKDSPLSMSLFALTLTAGITMSVGMPTQIRAESEQATTTQNLFRNKNIRVKFEPPGQGKPKETAGGASRSNLLCAQEQLNVGKCVIPLTPVNQEGLTVTERPTFLVYVPQISAKQILFTLVDKSKTYQYQKKIPLPRKEGIVSFKLPEEAPALEIGKNYQWSFVLIEEEGLKPDNPGVKGEIRRVEIDKALSAQLEQMSPIERAALYGEKGIWYETVATLAELVRSQPGNLELAETWKQLLNSVGLEAIAAKPQVQ
ncbi:MAG: DUF928 domain-containing protein [Oscillatoriaceae bacterium SKW80]|nr:DUF928 domain-containing protein [Oscillatoriaceae bacterium SKYG93]MCX8120079.1 DUF928 domain-containing protein [Oscillatoriaceae bacterium SKW80]MDW8454165.1 DUF928 domain-containing protein [Oscillatoriaceae cyanobacterium SKYGB_i_bin93]HIK29423.1 DUF928 domain-containing protein [Oscillatoriaceae cyanobacterium M7585_C2015_266]